MFVTFLWQQCFSSKRVGFVWNANQRDHVLEAAAQHCLLCLVIRCGTGRKPSSIQQVECPLASLPLLEGNVCLQATITREIPEAMHIV